jgi:hypothetical protein
MIHAKKTGRRGEYTIHARGEVDDVVILAKNDNGREINRD